MGLAQTPLRGKKIELLSTLGLPQLLLNGIQLENGIVFEMKIRTQTSLLLSLQQSKEMLSCLMSRE
jgi:hypothetical protein